MPSLDARDVIPGVRKIAVVRANGLGDLMFVVPALEALRAAYPDAEIALIAHRWHADFFYSRPGPVDRVIVAPLAPGVGAPEDYEDDPEELAAFFEAMRAERFDLALQMHGGGRYSNPFTSSLGARVTAGNRADDAPPLDRWSPYVYFQSETQRYLEVVSLVGAVPVTYEPCVSVTTSDLWESLSGVPDDEGPLVVLHPGSGGYDRRWPPEKFAAIGDALAREGARVAITGAEHEGPLVEAVRGRMGQPALDLAGKLSINGLTGLLARADLVVSSDSGPLHLANAVGARTVGIYCCYNLLNGAIPNRTRHRPVISWRLECPVCGASTITNPCQHRASYVEDVPVGEVLAAAQALLSGAGERVTV